MGRSMIEQILLENLVRIYPADTTIDGVYALTIAIDDMTPRDVKLEDKIKEDNRIKDRQTWKHTKHKHGINKYK